MIFGLNIYLFLNMLKIIVFLLFATPCFAQTLEQRRQMADHANYEIELKIEKLLFKYYEKGFLILEGEFIDIDSSGSELYSLGSKVQVILQTFWLKEESLKVDSSLRLVVCNYNWVHWVGSPDGSYYSYLSHYSRPLRCLMISYMEDGERGNDRICPTPEMPLLLCAKRL
jgi:hypothetical protein